MAYITAIQRYAIHDGEGIRTTVFWKGCPLRCKWCHNPETQKVGPELMDNPEACTGCGSCVTACPPSAISMEEEENGRLIAVTDRSLCNGCGACVLACPANIREIAGKQMTPAALAVQLRKDEMFFEESGGGVTFSGGEVLAAPYEEVLDCAMRLHRMGISLTIDTCGEAPWERIEGLLPYTDVFLYDLKCVSPALHQQYMGTGNARILHNLTKLLEEKGQGNTRIFLRIPLVQDVNGTDEEIGKMIQWLLEQPALPDRVHLLPYHKEGSAKYKRLGLSYPGEGMKAPEKETLLRWQKEFVEAGFTDTRIGG